MRWKLVQPAARVVATPCVVLLFAMPMPAPLLSEVVWHLQLWSAEYAGWLLYWIGVPSLVSADLIYQAERTFQVICQVAGRAGRGPEPGLVVVQTYLPGHYAIQAAAREARYGLMAALTAGFVTPGWSAPRKYSIRDRRPTGSGLRWLGACGGWRRFGSGS